MRKKSSSKRGLVPDTKYNDIVIQQFINNLLKDGKKNAAQRIVYGAMEIIAEKTSTNPLDIFHKAMTNVAPALEVRSRRVGGANYQVPTEVRPERRKSLAFRWLITYSATRKDKSMAMKLASELMAAANNEGSAVKKREDVHRMAEANKAFAHFRW